MNKHAAPPAKPRTHYQYKPARRGVDLPTLGIVFVSTVILSFLIARVAYRLYQRSIDAKIQENQRIQEQQSLDALLERY